MRASRANPDNPQLAYIANTPQAYFIDNLVPFVGFDTDRLHAVLEGLAALFFDYVEIFTYQLHGSPSLELGGKVKAIKPSTP